MADIYADRVVEALATAEHSSCIDFGVGRRGSAAPFDVKLNLECAVLNGEPAVIAFASDITERHRSEQRLAYLAYTGSLTGLPNRALFADRLQQARLAVARYNALMAVLMADPDGFKAVNDSYGHDTGDVVLQLVARRLHACIATATRWRASAMMNSPSCCRDSRAARTPPQLRSV